MSDSYKYKQHYGTYGALQIDFFTLHYTSTPDFYLYLGFTSCLKLFSRPYFMLLLGDWKGSTPGLKRVQQSAKFTLVNMA